MSHGNQVRYGLGSQQVFVNLSSHKWRTCGMPISVVKCSKNRAMLSRGILSCSCAAKSAACVLRASADGAPARSLSRLTSTHVDGLLPYIVTLPGDQPRASFWLAAGVHMTRGTTCNTRTSFKRWLRRALHWQQAHANGR